MQHEQVIDGLNKRDKLLYDWEIAKNNLEVWKAKEMSLRKEAFAILFPNAKEGTNKVNLGNGWQAKGVRNITYKLPSYGETIAVHNQIIAIGKAGSYLVNKLFRFKCELAEGEYKKLDTNDMTENEAKALIDTILTTFDGAPTLEIVLPKK